MVASFPFLACIGIVFTTLIVRVRKPPQHSPPSASTLEKDILTNQEIPNTHPAQRDTSLISFILWLPYRIFDIKPITKLHGIPPNIPQRRQTTSEPPTYEDVMTLSAVEEEKPPPSQSNPTINPPEPEKPMPPPSQPPSNPSPNLPYQAVRVLFLVWDSERSQNPHTTLLTQLRQTLGMTYHFSIHEFTLPSNALETPDIPLLHYLLDNSFFFKTSAQNERELVIVVYSGSGAVAHGQYNLITSCKASAGEPARMPWEWVETRLASAEYDSLFVMNSSYVPGTLAVTGKKVRGSNLVLAALGPDSGMRREVLGGIGERGGRSPGGKGNGGSWSTGFLETILGELQRNCEDGDLDGPGGGEPPIPLGSGSVRDLYSSLLVAHQRLCQPEQGSDRRPFCDFIKGADGEHENRVPVIRPLGRGSREERGEKSDEWTLVEGV